MTYEEVKGLLEDVRNKKAAMSTSTKKRLTPY